MSRDAGEEQSALEMANAIFAMLDTSGDGDISAAEMRSALIQMNPDVKVRFPLHLQPFPQAQPNISLCDPSQLSAAVSAARSYTA